MTHVTSAHLGESLGTYFFSVREQFTDFAPSTRARSPTSSVREQFTDFSVREQFTDQQ